MPAARRTREGHNRIPPRKRVAECGVCGESVRKDDLIPQRNTFVSRWHHGCLDNPNVFTGQLSRGSNYANTGTVGVAVIDFDQ